MKCIHSTTSLEEAEALCVVLREAGIHPLLENEHSAFTAGEMPGAAVPLGILVHDGEAGRARLAIHDARMDIRATQEDRHFARIIEDSRRRRRRRVAIVLALMVLSAAAAVAFEVTQML